MRNTEAGRPAARAGADTRTIRTSSGFIFTSRHAPRGNRESRCLDGSRLRGIADFVPRTGSEGNHAQGVQRPSQVVHRAPREGWPRRATRLEPWPVMTSSSADSPAPVATDDGKGGVRGRLGGLGRSFPGGASVLSGLDLDISAGAFVALVGPSGCGKSTLLRLVAGLDAPDAGTLSFTPALERTRGARSPIAYVFQDAHLLPWRTVLDNVALPLELAGVGEPARHAAARPLLGDVGLGDALARYPAQLSGGMRMRVSLARALVTRPRLLLLDEPFAALDDQLRALGKELGMTVLFVTHSLSEAAYLAERVVVLSRRPARVMLDRSLELPAERGPSLRAEPGFAHELGLLLRALERGDTE